MIWVYQGEEEDGRVESDGIGGIGGIGAIGQIETVGLGDRKRSYQSEQIKLEVENAIINIHDHNDPRTNAFFRTSL